MQYVQQFVVTQLARKTNGYGKSQAIVGVTITAESESIEIEVPDKDSEIDRRNVEWDMTMDMPLNITIPRVGDVVAVAIRYETEAEANKALGAAAFDPEVANVDQGEGIEDDDPDAGLVVGDPATATIDVPSGPS